MRLAFIFLFFLLITGCQSHPATYTQLAMGTIVEISLWEDTGLAELAFNEIKRIENKFSIFKPDSEISKNKISDEGRYLIEESIKYSKITDGAFDIGYRKDKKYDFGGIAKGYAVDRVAGIFKEKGVKRAMVNIGGNLFLIGQPPWSIGIKNPKDPNKLIGKIKIDKESGIATSGNYERPGHIIDPKTGKSASAVLSVTIVAPTAIEADALSTGVFVLGKEKGALLIEKLPEVEGVIIDNAGTWVSSGLKNKYESLY